MDEDRWIQARTATILINSLEAGSHEANFLTPSYLSNIYVQGLPFTAYHKIVSRHTINLEQFLNRLKLGLESNFSKNYGQGQQYDLDYPPNTAIIGRPRAFKNIPSFHTLSGFAEDNILLQLNEFKIDASLGLRAFTITSLAESYQMHNRLYLEPRSNLRLHLP